MIKKLVNIQSIQMLETHNFPKEEVDNSQSERLIPSWGGGARAVDNLASYMQLNEAIRTYESTTCLPNSKEIGFDFEICRGCLLGVRCENAVRYYHIDPTAVSNSHLSISYSLPDISSKRLSCNRKHACFVCRLRAGSRGFAVRSPQIPLHDLARRLSYAQIRPLRPLMKRFRSFEPHGIRWGGEWWNSVRCTWAEMLNLNPKPLKIFG